VGHIVYSCASRAQNGDTLFFMLGLDWYGSDKKSDGTRYAKLVFLHPIGSAGHVVHSDAPEARNGDALFFMLGWDRYRFNKKTHRDMLRRTYVFTSGGIWSHIVHLVHPGHETATQYFSCLGGTNMDSTKNALGHIMLNTCFCIRWDLRVTCFCIRWDLRGVKCRHTIFPARLEPVRIR
jgi:hypothetical protein